MNDNIRKECEEYMRMTWNTVGNLCKLDDKTRKELFGYNEINDIVNNFTALEVIYLIGEQYKKSRNKEIKVGDVVTVGGGDITFICTKDNSNGDYTKCHLVAGDGSVYEDCDKFDCQKTGKSIDIGEILKEIDT